MRSRFRSSSLAVSALLLIVLALVVAPAAASVVVPMADDDLIAGADVVVLGHVVRIEGHRDVFSDISTYITVRIDEVLKGALPGGEVTIRELGGQVGDRMGWVFANPEFVVGERVVLFMDQRLDGTLRTYQFYMGKFTVVTDPATGDLVAVRGLPHNVTVIPPAGAAAASVPLAAVGKGFDDFTRRIREMAGEPRPLTLRPRPVLPFASAAIPASGAVEDQQEFRFLGDPNPPGGVDPTRTLLRWNEPDSNAPVTMRIYNTGEPLAPTLGFDQVRAALRAWSRVPTSSFRFAEGPMLTSPGLGGFVFNGVNSISFRDPLDDIQDPFNCSGILAVAGISQATSSGGTTVNGRNFFRALEGDLVVNDGWESCTSFYQDFSNFTEVMTHELGHVLGLGHSADASVDNVNLGGRAGATMQPFAHFDGRQAGLHTDDRAGVTFIYPGRTLTIQKTGPGMGTVTSTTDGIDCGSDCAAGFAPNSTVGLTATPGPGSFFAGFVEPACAGGFVLMPSSLTSVTCTAMFTTDPDLQMTAVSGPTVASPGSTIVVNNTARNNGLDAGAFTIGLYLSNNSSTVTTLDRLLVTRRVTAGLAFNQTSVDATSVPIPVDVAPGTYFLGAIADIDGEVDEGTAGGENNNARTTTVPITIDKPDLRVTALTAPATAGTGLTISASATVSNLATANISAGASTLAFYLSSDGVIDGSDRRLAETRAIPSLARNATSAGTTTLTIPADLAPGTYFLIANADDLLAVDESVETNNKLATATTIIIRRPDLVVTSITAPAVSGPGMNVSVTHVVRNQAVAPGNAGASTSRLVLSADNVFGGDVELGTVAVGALVAGAQATVTRSVQIPGNTSAGVYWIFAQANALNAVIEADSPTQANNVRSTAASIVVGADLVVTAATPAPTATAPGLSVNVTNTVRNQGGQAAGAFDVGIYLSDNNTFDGGDLLIATRRVTAGLAPAATSTAVTAAPIPPNTSAGTYFLLVRADATGAAPGEVAEANENNNVLATIAIQIVKADLTMTSVTATPGAVTAGMNVSVTHTVRNAALAAGGAPASASRLFLSADATLDGADVQLGGDVPVGPLAGGASATVVRSVQIPPATAPGQYWIIAQANATNAVQEADSPSQTNNVRPTATPITVGPDLIVSAATAAPTAIAPGLTVSLSNTVRNQGAQAAGAFDVAIYLSVNNQYEEGVDGFLTGRRVAAGLAPGATSMAVTPVVIPGNLSAGTYFLIVRADSTSAAPGEVTEGHEGNNTLAVPVNVVRAELMVTSVTAPAIAARGTNVSVTHVVRNAALAAGGASPTVTRLYLSTDTTLSVDDQALLDVPVGPLVGGASATVMRSVQIPPATAPGRYWIIAQANATNTVLEADSPVQVNNIRATATQVLVGPDLTMSAGSVVPTATAPAQTVNVANTVRNQGAEATLPFAVGLFLSTDQVLDPGSDIFLGSRQVTAGLAAGAMSAVTTPVVIPSNLSAGTYFVLLWADSGGVNADADSTNNVRAIQLTLVRPDLTVPSVTVTPAAVAPGANVSVTQVVRNVAVAAGTAGPTTSRLFLSTDATLDGGDVMLLDVPIGALVGMAQASVMRSVQIPPGTTPGQYWIIAQANVTGAVVESNPGNNIGMTATPILVGPDLIVSAATAAPIATAPGLTVNLSSTVRNQGGQATPPFTVGFYLSTDNTFQLGGDSLLTSRVVGTGLAPEATSVATTPVAIPSNLSAGTYFLLVLADVGGTTPPNEVLEADETNNVRAVQISVVRADLTVLSVTAPAVGAPGANVSVTHVVRNLSPAAGAAPATVSRLFLSADAVLDGGDVQLGGDVPVGPLAGMAQATVTRSVQIPPATTPGVYRILAQANATGTVVEANDSNNVQTGAPIIIGPDLTVTTATAGTLAGPGTNLSVTTTIRNQGGQGAAASLVRFFLAQTGQPDVLLAATRAVPTLAPAAVSGPLVTQVTIPANTSVGTYFIRVQADGDAGVTEADETNNFRNTGNFEVKLPNLQVLSITPPTAAIRGKIAGAPTGSVVVKNLGPGPAAPFDVQVYATRDDGSPGAQVPGSGDMIFTRTVPALAPNAQTTLSGPVVVPETVSSVVRLAGNYYMSALADPAGVTGDPSPANNVLTWTSKKVPVLPDMTKLTDATVNLTLTADCGVTSLLLTGPFNVTSQSTANPSSFAGRLTLDDTSVGFHQVYNVTGTVQSVDIVGTPGKVLSAFTYTATIDNDFASSGSGSINGAAPALNFTGGSIAGQQAGFPSCNFAGSIDVIRTP